MYIVIYSVATGRVRRALKPDSEPKDVDAYIAQCGVGKGERFIVQPDGGTLIDWQAAVTAKTGIVPVDDRYVVVDDKNSIVCAVLADPAIDSIAGHELVLHAEADEKWAYDGIEFVEPPKEIVLTTIAQRQALLAAIDQIAMPLVDG